LKFNFEIEFEIEEVGLLRAKSVGFSWFMEWTKQLQIILILEYHCN
jgi:hypothetical protein